MHKVLTSVKAEVRALRDGEQALTLVNHERFDVFVDLQMPKVDSFELARRIWASFWNKSPRRGLHRTRRHESPAEGVRGGKHLFFCRNLVKGRGS